MKLLSWYNFCCCFILSAGTIIAGTEPSPNIGQQNEADQKVSLKKEVSISWFGEFAFGKKEVITILIKRIVDLGFGQNTQSFGGNGLFEWQRAMYGLFYHLKHQHFDAEISNGKKAFIVLFNRKSNDAFIVHEAFKSLLIPYCDKAPKDVWLHEEIDVALELLENRLFFVSNFFAKGVTESFVKEKLFDAAMSKTGSLFPDASIETINTAATKKKIFFLIDSDWLNIIPLPNKVRNFEMFKLCQKPFSEYDNILKIDLSKEEVFSTLEKALGKMKLDEIDLKC